MDRMVVVGIVGLRMNQYVEAGAVQHQPGDQPGELGGRKGGLIHRNRMRADRLVAPTAELHAEAVADRLPQPFGDRPRLGIVIDMGVIAADLPGPGEALYHAGLLRRSGGYRVRRSPASYPSPVRAPAASG